ncbi:MAG: MBL fold metallo-hydrolase [Promethearchaeota archaeon]
MVEVIEIADGVYAFAQFLKENDISVSCFLIQDEKQVIIETGTISLAKSFLSRMAGLGPLDKTSHIFVTHEHQDHFGGLPEFISEAYNAQVVAHKNITAQLAFSGIVGRNLLVEGGEAFRIGKRTLRIYHAPIETKGTIVFLLEPDGILFTGDYFGQLSKGGWSPYPQVPENVFIHNIVAFHQALGYQQKDFTKYLSPLKKKDLHFIAPSHGSMTNESVPQVFEKVIKAKLGKGEKGGLWQRIFSSR